MTREMNKSEYHATWYFRVVDSIDSINCTFTVPKERELDDWIKPFVQSINERFKRENK